jgi:succinate dehydrogenase / fumarate reductase cytochrome b subunit
MAASILNRIAGVGLYFGALIVAWGAVALAMGPEAYGVFTAAMGSIPGELVLLALTLGFFFHLGAGIRHLFWDAGVGFQPRTATLSAVIVIAFTIVATAAVWALAFATGGAR